MLQKSKLKQHMLEMAFVCDIAQEMDFIIN